VPGSRSKRSCYRECVVMHAAIWLDARQSDSEARRSISGGVPSSKIANNVIECSDRLMSLCSGRIFVGVG
jgi:hypothetical protein